MDTTDISKQIRNQILRASELYENGRQDLLNILEAYEQGNLEPSSTLTLAINSIRIDFKTLCSMMDGVGKMDTTKIENKLKECADIYDNGKQDALSLLRAYQEGRYGDLAALTIALENVADDIKQLKAISDALDHLANEVYRED